MKTDRIQIELIAPPARNPRTSKDPAALRELAESIQEHGVIQSILVKPGEGGRFEVIAGDRRFEASQMAVEELQFQARELRPVNPAEADRLDELAALRALIPAIILEGAEIEAAEELQLIENLQREDMAAIDVARAFRRLIDERGHTARSLAQKIGVSPSFIAERVRLCEAPRDIIAALSSGVIPIKTALMVARIPSFEDRDRAADLVLRPTRYEEPLSAMMTEELIRREFVVSLKTAGFDAEDLTLVPEAGACSACPHRAGNNPAFSVGCGRRAGHRGVDPNSCLNPSCFRDKSRAQWARLEAEAAEMGRSVLNEETAARVFSGAEGRIAFDSPYVDLDGRPGPREVGHYNAAAVPTWRELLDGKGVAVSLARHPITGRVHEMVRRELALAAIKLAEESQQPTPARREEFSGPAVIAEGEPDPAREARVSAKAKSSAMIARVDRLAVRLEIIEFDQPLLVELAVAAYATHYDASLIVRRWLRLGDRPEAFRAAASVWGSNRLLSVLAVLLVSDEIRLGGESLIFETVERLAGIDQ